MLWCLAVIFSVNAHVNIKMEPLLLTADNIFESSPQKCVEKEFMMTLMGVVLTFAGSVLHSDQNKRINARVNY